ncbi:replication initiation protein [Carnobacterium maltaromaticum]|uniref:replication initiation protein n=1 Tax=Carnobacterium maltaromaticum TaxID=2751 RepID=UPI000557A3AA|nr:replication initiation protein [Carnobacterium maltaromaticum]KRN68829.1 replication protein [Carnobacterium maltaromaticum DSM 20342]MBQ2671550.1 replication initiation protein [Clostridia bacterium]
MSNEIVRYNNVMNDVSFRKFTPIEFDLFFSLCAKMKRLGTETIVLTFDEIKDLIGYSSRNKERFVADLESMYSKLLNLNFRFEDENIIVRFVLFNRYEIDKKKSTVTIKVNTDFEFILNEITTNFTRYELQSFTELKSSYSKSMYRILMQFRSTGFYKVTIDEFKRILDIPESYKMGNIDQYIFKPINKELAPLFDYFEIKKIKKKGRGRGGVVSHFEFYFKEKKNLKVPLHNWTED